MFLLKETVLDDFSGGGLLLSPVVQIHAKRDDRGLNGDLLTAAAHLRRTETTTTPFSTAVHLHEKSVFGGLKTTF